MKKTLEEHINRIKELSLINENNINALDKAIDSSQFEAGIENTMKNLLQNVTKDLDKLGTNVGDKDGTLEIQGEAYSINEAGLGFLIGGSVLAAPKIIEMIGKGTKQLGIKVKSQWIKDAGEAASKAGHKLHHSYESIIVNLLKKSPKYAKADEKTLKGIASGILLGLTVAAGIASLNGVISAAKAGQVGLAAIETGLTGVKGIEVASAARSILPNILNGILS